MILKISITALLILNLAMLGAVCGDIFTSNRKVKYICTRFYETMFIVDITLAILAFLAVFVWGLIAIWI